MPNSSNSGLRIAWIHLFSLASIIAVSMTVLAAPPASPRSWMCVPGELIFSEQFDPDTTSDRWGFKADFALRDNALLRTNVHPNDSKRVFLKDPSFHNTIIQFDFKLTGKTTDLRLVTGSGGGYNSVTRIRPRHFEINTPVDRDAGIVPAHLGECVREMSDDRWRTITIEYWDDEIVAHLSDDEFVIGTHPIIDRTRKYFAFQFDLPGAAIDNVRVWQATGQRSDWGDRRERLRAAQAARPAIERDPPEHYKREYTKLKSRLTLQDETYRTLVARLDVLQAALHADYANAFISHKETSKRIAKEKQRIKATFPEFKVMEADVNRAARAEAAYVLSKNPELAKLKESGVAKHRYPSELGQARAKLESVGDQQLASLVAETKRRQEALEARFPKAFASLDAAIAKRQSDRKSLNDDPVFQARNRAVVDAGKAIKDYELKAEPSLAQLSAEAKAYNESAKPKR